MRYPLLPIIVLTCFLPGWSVAQSVSKESKSPQDPTGLDATNPSDQAQTPVVSDRVKRDAYYALVGRARAIKTEINRLIGSMPIGFPRLQKEQTAKIDALKKELMGLQSQARQSALDAFMEAPGEDPSISMVALNILTSCLSPRSIGEKFDPKLALEIATNYMKFKPENANVYLMAFRATFALQDFEQAKTMLEKVREMGTELNDEVFERLELVKQNWDRELQLRLKETEADDLPRVKFETSVGDFEVELFENHAPETVGNFINLVEKGFYDGLTFHVVRPGTLSQSGCPLGDGKGNPGYKIACECYGEDIRHHFSGTISMSNSGRDTGGSQFFIAHQPNPVLDGKYTVFGRILDNIDLIYEMNPVDKTQPIPGQLEPSVIKKVTVIRKRDHEYVPNIVETIEQGPNPVIDSNIPNSSLPGGLPKSQTPGGG